MFESCRGHQNLRNATRIFFGRANATKIVFGRANATKIVFGRANATRIFFGRANATTGRGHQILRNATKIVFSRANAIFCYLIFYILKSKKFFLTKFNFFVYN